jgi:hypothetical protein
MLVTFPTKKKKGNPQKNQLTFMSKSKLKSKTVPKKKKEREGMLVTFLTKKKKEIFTKKLTHLNVKIQVEI